MEKVFYQTSYNLIFWQIIAFTLKVILIIFLYKFIKYLFRVKNKV